MGPFVLFPLSEYLARLTCTVLYLPTSLLMTRMVLGTELTENYEMMANITAFVVAPILTPLGLVFSTYFYYVFNGQSFNLDAPVFGGPRY